MALTPSHTPSIFEGPSTLIGRWGTAHTPTATSMVDYSPLSFPMDRLLARSADTPDPATTTTTTTTATTTATTTVLVQPTLDLFPPCEVHGMWRLGPLCLPCDPRTEECQHEMVQSVLSRWPGNATTASPPSTVPTHTKHGHPCIGGICPPNGFAGQHATTLAAMAAEHLLPGRSTTRHRGPSETHRRRPTTTRHRRPTGGDHRRPTETHHRRPTRTLRTRPTEHPERRPTTTHRVRPTTRFPKRPPKEVPTKNATRDATSPASTSAAEPTRGLAKRQMEWALLRGGAPFWSWYERPTFTSAGEQTKGRIPWETAGVCLAGVALVAIFLG